MKMHTQTLVKTLAFFSCIVATCAKHAIYLEDLYGIIYIQYGSLIVLIHC